MLILLFKFDILYCDEYNALSALLLVELLLIEHLFDIVNT